MAQTRAHGTGLLASSMAPLDWVLLGFVLLACVGQWASSAKLLVSSGWRDGGRVLSCVYFAGTRMVEWQYLDMAPGADQLACPIVKLS